ncbi:MAG TPA: hypothetical protein EYP67_03040 [Methanosarcinales archaeon]|nr:hypothetical protein [Methanosarcinales archaeon]
MPAWTDVSISQKSTIDDMPLTIRNKGFHLDYEPELLVSGSVHYWRLDRFRWDMILDRVREMGFGTICTYVPWGVHETAPGEFDFGEINPDYNLDAFLTLCEEKDMHVLLRPGPHVNSEITYVGFPKRILHDPDIQSVTADGTPVIFPSPPRMFPVPSYASEKFYMEVGTYLDRVSQIIREHLHPEGCIIAVQADNELSFFLRTQPYDHDYSAGALHLYRQFLKEKYRDVVRLNELYGTNHGSFDEVLPPRDFGACSMNDLPYYLDWIEYKEYYLQYGLGRIAQMLKDRGVDTLIYHNLPGMCAKPPYNHVMMEKIVDVVGFDLYYYKEEYHKVKRCIQYLNGTSRVAFAPEFASGFVALPIPAKPIMFDDIRFTTHAALMHGISGINFYMLVERERWVGSPVNRFGGVRRDRFEFYQSLNRLLERMNYQDLSVKCEGILLINRDCARLELASSLLTPIPILGGITPEYYVSEDCLGFGDVIQLEYGRQWDALYYGFGAAKYAVGMGDTELSEEMLGKYGVVAVPTFDFMSRGVQEKLINYVKNGGCLVMGPRIPVFDETMSRCDILGRDLPGPWKRADLVTIDGMDGIELRDADLFDIDSADAFPLLTDDGNTLIYRKFVGSGSIIHFGFLFPKAIDGSSSITRIIDLIASAAGLIRQIPCTDPQIDVAIHTSDEKEILFVANTGPAGKDVDIGRTCLDLESPDNEVVMGPVITVPGYMVRILEVCQR